MKKIKLMKIGAVLISAFVFSSPLLALAATTASLSPSTINVVPGQKFDVVVSVDPKGVANYAEKLEVDYPADTLQVSSFTPASGWMAMTQTGYDSIDNTNGVLIKTAGYPGGISSSATFGTISFSAKKTGSGKITIGNSSLAFEVSSQDAITGSGSSFAVTASTVVPNTTTEEPTPAPAVSAPTTETANTAAVSQSDQSSQAAAVAETSGSGSSWIWVLIVLVLLVAGGWAYIAFKSKENKGQN